MNRFGSVFILALGNMAYGQSNNIAKTFEYSSLDVAKPTSNDEIISLLENQSYKNFKPIGTRDSTNDVSDTDGLQISLEQFKKVYVDAQNQQITFGAGVQYWELQKVLEHERLILKTQPALYSEANVVGSIIAGAHGSIYDESFLASQVSKFTAVLSDGRKETYSREMTPYFFNHMMSFGNLNLITSMTMDLDKSRDHVYLNCNYDNVKTQDLVSLRKMSSENLVSTTLETNWETPRLNWVHLQQHQNQDQPQCDVAMFNSRLENTKLFEESQPQAFSEYYVSKDQFQDAYQAIYGVSEKFAYLQKKTLIQPVKGDERLPFVGASDGKDTMSIKFIWKSEQIQEVWHALTHIEQALDQFDARPQLSGLFRYDHHRINELYNKDIQKFKELSNQVDHDKKFDNCFTQRIFYGNTKCQYDSKWSEIYQTTSKRVLITGGMGYIGSHTIVEMVKQGFKVVIIDNMYNANNKVLERMRQITGLDEKNDEEQVIVYEYADLTDKESMERVFKLYKPDSVIHFAGLKAVGESVSKPLFYYDVNVGGTVNLLQVMEENDCKFIVFSSSATVYGDNPLAQETDNAMKATNPYGQTKAIIEQILRDTAKADKQFTAVALRYFNPVGAHESALIGEDPRGIPNNLMPYIQKVASGELPHLNVYGSDYNTRDGTGVRDYIHIQDLALGHIAAFTKRDNMSGFNAFNLGTGQGATVFDVVQEFKKQSGLDIPTVIKDRRPGDVEQLLAVPNKANEFLEWKAEKSLAEMCRDAWNWVRRNPEGYNGPHYKK